jgi:long-chain acyl-CoA synthetase
MVCTIQTAAPPSTSCAASNVPWRLSYPAGVSLELCYPEVPAYALLEEAATRFPDRTAIVCAQSHITYAELLAQARQCAAALDRLGVGVGTRVGVLLPNVPEYLIVLCGAWMCGATVVQLNPLLVEEELQSVLQFTDCQVAVTLDMLARPLRNLLGRSPLRRLLVTSLQSRLEPLQRWLYPIARRRRSGVWRLGGDPLTLEFNRLLAAEAPEPPYAEFDPHTQPALIQPTGGTTGEPKCVVLSHRNLVANALQLRAWCQRTDGTDILLAVLPYFHCYGLTVAGLSPLAMGATTVLCPRFDAAELVRLIQKHRPTCLPGVPTLYVKLNRYLQEHPADLSCITLAISGAAPLDPRVREEFESHGARNLIEGYGLSEASPVTHVNPTTGDRRPGTMGLPLPDTIARVVDMETGTRELGPGEVGELVVSGPQVMLGYLNDEATTRRVIRDGWLYTGDIATRDEDGFFRIVDRKKDLIKTGGFNVFPIEVESVLRRHPDVSDAAVVGVPDLEAGELVKAFVVPINGVQVPALHEFCGEHLAKHKRPRVIELCPDLPRNFLGKVLRRHLRTSV